MRALPVRLALALVAAALIAAILLAACGGQEAHLPEVQAQTMVGPDAGEVTITLASSGEGAGVAEIVLTYPDGKQKVVGNGVLQKDETLSWGLPDLPAGAYQYTVFAVATATPPPDASFPANARIEGNIIASGGFTIH